MSAPAQNEDGSLVEPRDLTSEEYDQTYATGSGGHRLTPEQADALQRLANSQLAFERAQTEQRAQYAALPAAEREARNIGVPNPDWVEPAPTDE